MYRLARLLSNLTLEEAAELIPCGARSIWRYEKGEKTPLPDIVQRMSEVYNCADLSGWYCKNVCQIGKKKIFKLRFGFKVA